MFIELMFKKKNEAPKESEVQSADVYRDEEYSIFEIKTVTGDIFRYSSEYNNDSVWIFPLTRMDERGFSSNWNGRFLKVARSHVVYQRLVKTKRTSLKNGEVYKTDFSVMDQGLLRSVEEHEYEEF